MRYRFLIARRIIQLGILILFFVGNLSWIEISDRRKIVYQGNISVFIANNKNLSSGKSKLRNELNYLFQGNLSSSKIFGIFPMSDPLAVMQLFLAGGALALDVYLGLLIVLVLYGTIFGRAFCSFVCPMNLISDLAAILHRKLKLSESSKPFFIDKNTKYGVLVMTLLLSFLLGVPAFEMVSPIAMLQRGVVFGMGIGFFGILTVFLFDLFWIKNGFCGYICPLGAIYSLIGKYSFWRVKYDLQNCTKCMKCIQICPENKVLHNIGKRSGAIDAMACTKCGRCIEECRDNALSYGMVNLLKRRRDEV